MSPAIPRGPHGCPEGYPQGAPRVLGGIFSCTSMSGCVPVGGSRAPGWGSDGGWGGAVERALTEDRPGRTAHEVALELAPVFPAEAAALAEAADAFDAVRYGGLGATADRAARVRQLESRIARARPVLDDAAVAR